MKLRIWEKFKAWRRGEVMRPGVSRGRCFVKKEDLNKPTIPGVPAPDSVKRVSAKPIVKLVGLRVIRANGDIEDIKHG